MLSQLYDGYNIKCLMLLYVLLKLPCGECIYLFHNRVGLSVEYNKRAIEQQCHIKAVHQKALSHVTRVLH